ncbi:glycogen synthase [mine drainage metagenome]|uniref:Glycogen synthase n=1 Tax=mine drainage metagenome TaxID=410659 RepID=A0A1J5QTW5_9ZZZZ
MGGTARSGVWFPAIRSGSGADVFVERLAAGLNALGVRAEVSWLPHHAEYAPWLVAKPRVPEWAGVAHLNTWLPRRFVPKRIPTVQTLHFCVHGEEFAPYRSKLQAAYHGLCIEPRERINVRCASRVVAVSAETARQSAAVFGRRDIGVIANGVPVDAPFLPQVRDLPHRPFRLLYLGNWSRRKGADLLAPIMRNLGDGFELLYTSDRAGAHGNFEPPPYARSLGRLSGADAIAGACHEADALLFPSRMEGLALSVLEAMACGLPVIAARVSSLPEVVDHGSSGWLCESATAASFAAGARLLRDHTQLWRSMGEQARQKVVREFSLARMVRHYLELYGQLLAEEWIQA